MTANLALDLGSMDRGARLSDDGGREHQAHLSRSTQAALLPRRHQERLAIDQWCEEQQREPLDLGRPTAHHPLATESPATSLPLGTRGTPSQSTAPSGRWLAGPRCNAEDEPLPQGDSVAASSAVGCTCRYPDYETDPWCPVHGFMTDEATDERGRT